MHREDDAIEMCRESQSPQVRVMWKFGKWSVSTEDDSATCHVVKATLDWYEENRVNRMDWPTRNSHLNPIVNLRDELNHQIKGRSNHPKFVKGLAHVFSTPNGSKYHCSSSKHLWKECPGELRL
ncbi:hypothetical protein TNCV_4551781 [Trichonephila clavipes]|nr:hypothetical protein TNCV_4551781 [Trichonephila clavipes]